jgi:hypothetical protein
VPPEELGDATVVGGGRDEGERNDQRDKTRQAHRLTLSGQAAW